MRPRIILTLITFLIATAAANAGAWGYKSFENDDALDWVENALKPDRQTAVERAIESVAKGSGYLQAPQASMAIAACEVLAAAQGRASPDLPKDVGAIGKRLSSQPKESLRKDARAALDRILTKSELRDLWQDSKENFEKWKRSVEDLKSRV